MSEENKKIQSLRRKWHKRARRYMFFTGIAGTLLFLGLSFIRPHIITIINLAYVPCILYAVFIVYQYYQYKKEVKGLEDRE